MADHFPSGDGIDSTPILPEPPARFIAAAEQDIPGILLAVPAYDDGTIEAYASYVAQKLVDAKHTPAAAQWAIHHFVVAGRLRTAPIVDEMPSSKNRGGTWQGGERVARAIPKGKPTPFDSFNVIATDALWAWWRASDAGHVSASLPVAKEPGVISLNVLASNLTMHGFPDWRKRFESWPEVPAIRLACARLFPAQPFTSSTIELLIAWFQERGLTPEQARHLPLSEARRRLAEASRTTEAKTPKGQSELQNGGPLIELTPAVGSERPSPFTIPKPEIKSVFAAADECPARTMTVGNLVHNLVVFADFYERASADIDGAAWHDRPSNTAHRDVIIDQMQRDFKSAIAINRVRAYVLGKFGAELTIGTAQRFLGDVIRACNLTADAAEALTLAVAMDRLESPSTSTEPAPTSVAAPSEQLVTPHDASLALLRVFTNGLADERIALAMLVLADDKLTVNEKLTKIDALIPIPSTASAEQLGEMLGKSKQAVLKSEWWKKNRQGERGNEIGRRRTGHEARAKTYETPAPDRDDD